eukprot:5969244-Pyramimonas_sp.AAC.1
MNGSNAPEVQRRMRSMHARWSVIGLCWHERGLHRLERELFLGKVVASGITGLEAFAFKPAGYQIIDSCTVNKLPTSSIARCCRFLRWATRSHTSEFR